MLLFHSFVSAGDAFEAPSINEHVSRVHLDLDLAVAERPTAAEHQSGNQLTLASKPIDDCPPVTGKHTNSNQIANSKKNK